MEQVRLYFFFEGSIIAIIMVVVISSSINLLFKQLSLVTLLVQC